MCQNPAQNKYSVSTGTMSSRKLGELADDRFMYHNLTNFIYNHMQLQKVLSAGQNIHVQWLYTDALRREIIFNSVFLPVPK